METKTYKIVFSGELAFDTDADEVSAALAEKCGYPQQVIDKILHSKKITIKKGLGAEPARRYKNFFDRIGLMCDMVSEQEVRQMPAGLKKEPVATPEPVGRDCPKCGAGGQTSNSCLSCGIIFERYEKARSRHYEDDIPPLEARVTVTTQDPLWQRLLRQSGIQTLIIIATIMLFRGPLHNFYLLAIAMTSVAIIAYFLFQANETGDSALDLCSSFIAVWPQKCDKEEKELRDMPLLTSIISGGLIVLFYLLTIFMPGALIRFSFLPAEHSFLFSTINFFLAPLLHTDPSHLWINTVTFWLLSCHIEMHLGKKLLPYVAAAITLPQLIYAGVAMMLGYTPHVVGSSALIACLLGALTALKPRSFIESSLPIFGPLSQLTGLRVQIEVLPVVLTAIFFLIASGGNLSVNSLTACQDLLYPLTGLVCGFGAGYIYLFRTSKR